MDGYEAGDTEWSISNEKYNLSRSDGTTHEQYETKRDIIQHCALTHSARVHTSIQQIRMCACASVCVCVGARTI